MPITVDDTRVRANLARVRRSMQPVGIDSHIVLMAGVIHSWFQAKAMRRFRSEGDAASGKWPALLPATESWRRAKGYGAAHPINVRTGDLKTLLTEEKPNVGHDGIGSFLLWPGNAQNRGNRPIKMRQAAGQVSRKGGGKGIARPVVAMDIADVAYIHKAFQTFIMTGQKVKR